MSEMWISRQVDVQPSEILGAKKSSSDIVSWYLNEERLTGHIGWQARVPFYDKRA
jgi:hypothetical protein